MNHNRSVQRCLALLRCFRHGYRQTLTELARAIDLPHSTVLRFLHTLEHEGYVRREGTLWSLTPQMLEIGFTALQHTGVNEAIQASLQAFAESCAGTVNIGEQLDDGAIIIARAIAESERKQIVIVNLRVGDTLPASSALYLALDLAPEASVVVSYADRKLVTLAIPLHNTAGRKLSLGLTVNIDKHPPERVEADLLERLRTERHHLRMLLQLGN